MEVFIFPKHRRSNDRSQETGVNIPQWGTKRRSNLQRLKSPPLNFPLPNTQAIRRTASNIFRLKRIFNVSHYDCFCFYSLNWKIIPIENFQSLHIKRCLTMPVQYSEAVKIYSCSQNLCSPQWSFGSIYYSCLPVKTQEKGSFPSALWCRAIILGRNE